MPKRRIRRLLVGSACGLVLLSSCGDDAGPAADGSGTSADTTASAPSTSDATLATGVADATAGSGTTADDSGADETAEPPPPSGAWETRASLSEGPRQETGVAALEGEVYVVGGFTPGGVLVPRVEAYDPAADSWRTVAELPQPLHHANVAAAAGRLFVAGYLDGLTFEARGDLLVYDPARDAWSTAAAMPVGTERGSSGVAVHQDRIYLFGGFRDTTLADVWAYDPALDLWDVAADLPEPLEHLGAATIGDRIYVVGGRDNGIEAHTNALHIYDPVADEWSSGAPMPTSRGGIFVAAHQGVLYVGGGEGNVDDPSGVFGQFEAYDPATDDWTILPAMPTPRHGSGAATVGDVVLFPGGATEQALGPVATHEAWRPG